MKPWEETWEPALRGQILCDGEPVLFALSSDRAEDADDRRARLAACAPEMARMLKKLECDRIGECGTCGGDMLNGGHADDCEWVRVLKKAGVIE